LVRLNESIENNPIIIILAAIVAGITILINACSFYKLVNPHNYYGIREVANEYYVLIHQCNDLDEAREIANDLEEIAFLSNELSSMTKENNENSVNSDAKKISVALDPDQVFFGRNDRTGKDKGKFIVGFDLMPEQGNLDECYGELERIRKRFKEVTEELKVKAVLKARDVLIVPKKVLDGPMALVSLKVPNVPRVQDLLKNIKVGTKYLRYSYLLEKYGELVDNASCEYFSIGHYSEKYDVNLSNVRTFE
jgi:hypothetical protein